MDARILTACRLLMEVAAAQLSEAAASAGRDGDSPVTREAGALPFSAPGDNPRFEPARFAALRRDAEAPSPASAPPAAPALSLAAVQSVPAASEPAPEPYRPAPAPAPRAPSPETVSPRDASAAPFAPRPVWAAESAAEPAPALASAPAYPLPESAQAPVAALTMKDISDHFERDARRY
jgi:hypothetical protein